MPRNPIYPIYVSDKNVTGATRADSVNIYNNALLLEDYFNKNNNYIKKDLEKNRPKLLESLKREKIFLEKQKNKPLQTYNGSITNDEAKKAKQEGIDIAKNNIIKISNALNGGNVSNYIQNLENARKQFKKLSLDSGKYTNIKGNKIEEKAPYQEYYKPLNENQFYQREFSFTNLDLRSPMALYDKRIEPQSYSIFDSQDLNTDFSFKNKIKNAKNETERKIIEKNYNKFINNKNTSTDRVEIYKYDPLAVMPFDMIPLDKQQQRIEKYGISGVPKEIIDANPDWIKEYEKTQKNKNAIHSKDLHDEQKVINKKLFSVPISGPQEFEPTIERPQQEITAQEQEKLNIPLQEGTYLTREQQGQELGGTRYVDKKTGKLIGQINNGAFEYNPLWIEMNPELQNQSQFAKGGQMNKTNLLEGLVKKIMTSNVDGVNTIPNAEIEDKEMVKTPDGQVYEAEGEKHEDGGIKVNLEDKTRILTDRGTPNGQNRKLVSEIFDINVKGKDSFSDVLRKIEKKIGINRLEEEQLEIAEKVKKNLETEDKNTRDLNDEFYSSKLNEAEAQREQLEQTKSEAYDLLYSMQESQKGANDTYYDKETNIYVKRAQGGEILFPKSEQAKVLKYAQDNGITNPQDLVSHFQNKFKNGGMMNSMLPKFNPGGEYEKELERLRKENNAIGSNEANTKVGNKNWDAMFYQPMYKAQAALGLPQQQFKNHAEYQQYIRTYLPKQLTGLYRSGDIELNNKQRQMLEKAKVKGANQKIKFSDLRPEDLELLKNEYGSDDNFILEGYVDGIAGKRGLNVLPGEATNEEYEKIEDPLKGTSYNNKNIPVYLQYGNDKKIKRENNIPTIYYPKPVNAPAPVQKDAVNPAQDPANTASGKEIDPTIRKYKPLANPFNAMPAQYDMYPSALRLPSLIVPPTREMSYMKVSPEQALQENARQYGAIQDRVVGTPDGTQGLVMSDVAGKLFNANAQAVGQANQQNIGLRTQFDQMDTQYRSNMDLNRANALGNYGRLADTAVGNTFNAWKKYYQSRNAKDILGFKDMQTMRMAEGMTPDVNYNPYIGDYEYNNPNIYLGNTVPDNQKAAKELALARQLLKSVKESNKKTD